MGQRGPNKKPAALKVLQGQKGARRAAKYEPKPQAKAPPCPSWLSSEAQKHWRRLAPKLEAIGMLTELVGDAFSVYCASYASWRAAERQVAEAGEIVDGKANPAARVARAYRDAAIRLGRDFGLTPGARGGMRVVVDPPEDEFERFLREKPRKK